MAILTTHHWDEDQEREVRAMRRVTRRIFPVPEAIVRWLEAEVDVREVPIARDTPDWMLGSFWAHPDRVLDAEARNSTSGFARMPPEVVKRVVRAVERDLQDGIWDARHGHLRGLDEFDAGLRLLVAGPA
jgi:hypothetical protein